MNASRVAGTVLAFAIGLTAMSSDAREAPVPASLPPGANAGVSAVAPALVAALSESIPSPPRPATIAPARLRASVPVVMAGSAVVGGASGGTFGSRFTGLLRLGVSRRLAVEARTGLLTLDRGEASERRLVRNGARFLLDGPGGGAWVGTAFEHSLAGARLPGSPLLGLGAWTAPGHVTLAVSLEQTVERARIATVLRAEPPADTVEALYTTVFEDRLVRGTSALVSGRWERGRIGAETVAGITLSRYTTPRRWMQTSIDVALRPRLTLFTTVGDVAPRWLALDAGLSRKASLGFKLTSGVHAAAAAGAERRSDTPDFRLRHLGEDWYVVHVRAAAAGSVEVMGDFSAWKPLALGRVTGARWALALRMEPGVHQIQVRVDGGAWSPPAGLPTASDGFNGDVGVFVAR